jgi:uncharacterized radical SAM protein YgiQ
MNRLTDFLPTTKKELELRGWKEVDVILFSGDAYVDHPSFGAALIGRLLEAQGLKVAIVPQPDWRGDHRDFTKLGRPRLFFGVTAGNMDSMVNHYTAGKRLRSDDAYTANGKAGARPDYATVVYSRILRELYPDTPILLGGIEASMRRLTHYDYWSDTLKPSILIESDADLLVYGMGELPLKALCYKLRNSFTDSGQEGYFSRKDFAGFRDIPQTAFIQSETSKIEDDSVVILHSHESCLKDKRCQAENYKHIEEESNKLNSNTLIQLCGNKTIVVNPPFPPMSTDELDQSYEYPYTRYPHPKYKDKTIPAFEMIKFSVNIHRGCFGGCAFCTISAHQGKFVMNRSLKSVLNEVKLLTLRDDFKGYLSDLGGPSANMYRMAGKDLEICSKCKRPSCIYPGVCGNLNTDHGPLLELYRAVDALPGIRKSFIGSGIRYDMLVSDDVRRSSKSSAREYLKEVVESHVSGRLKVAPEHTSSAVLQIMRKPSFETFKKFNQMFEELEDERLRKSNSTGRQQLIPYFISSHPGCTERDMAQLASETRKMNFKLEQIQDFTPTPMTLATEIYYTGLNPYTLEPVFTAKTKQEKEKQRSYFFWYKK